MCGSKNNIPGFENIDANAIQTAVKSIQAGSEQQQNGADPQQAMGLLNTMPPRALGNIVKQVLSKGDDESKQVAAMVMKAAGGQQAANQPNQQ